MNLGGVGQLILVYKSLLLLSCPLPWVHEVFFSCKQENCAVKQFRESRVDVHSLGLEYSRWYCRWHFYSKTPAIPVSRLPFVDIPYWDRLFFHRWNLWFCFISFEQSHRELPWIFVRFPDSYFTASLPFVICDKMPNACAFEWTSLRIHKTSACNEARAEAKSPNQKRLVTILPAVKQKKTQTQGQDVRQLSDFILVSRSPKSSLFFPSLTMVRRDSALSLGVKQLRETEWCSPLFRRPVPAPPVSR